MSNILELIKDEGLDQVSHTSIQKGKVLFKNKVNDIQITEFTATHLKFAIPSEYSDTLNYEVNFSIDDEVELVDLSSILDCDCECKQFKRVYECKHIATAVFYVLKNYTSLISQDYYITELKLKSSSVDSLSLDAFVVVGDSFQSLMQRAHNLYKKYDLNRADENTIGDISFDQELKTWQITIKSKKTQIFQIHVDYSAFNKIEFKCSCGGCNSEYPCKHVEIVARWLTINKLNGFKKVYNFEFEKNALASKYKVPLDSAFLNLFKFSYAYYGFEVTIKKPEGLLLSEIDIQNLVYRVQVKSIVTPSPPKQSFEHLGYIINFSEATQYSAFKLSFLGVKIVNSIPQPISAKINVYTYPESLAQVDPFMIRTLDSLGRQGLVGYAKSIPSIGYIQDNAQQPFQYLSGESLKLISNYTIEKLIELWSTLEKEEFVFVNFKNSSIKDHCRVNLAMEPMELQFEMDEDKVTTRITMKVFIQYDNNKIQIDSKEVQYGFLNYKGMLYRPKSIEDYNLMLQFSLSPIEVHSSFKSVLFEQIVKPILVNYPLKIDKVDIESVVEHVSPIIRIELREDTKKLILSLVPSFVYNDRIVQFDDDAQVLKSFENNIVRSYPRNTNLEQEAIQTISSLHENFENKSTFTLPIKECLKDAWFVRSMKQLQEMGYEIVGRDKLSQLNISPFEPEWKMKASSEIDWFDLQVEVCFDDQIVSLTDIRKAIMDGSFMVRLNNGSLGLIPENWIKKYGMLLKMGDLSKEGNIKVNKLHFTLIDELYGEINEQHILDELNEKKKKLAQIEQIKHKKLSKHINAELRSYQLEGLYWLQTLEELGWGACLADDMGLGKTLQSISFIQYLKDKYKKISTLVVCPTSLVYNWEAELQKFAPKLSFVIYYGADRKFNKDELLKYDIIITSYGHLRSDIEEFKNIEFNYVILDESQAIKNPTAQISKCVQLLKSKGRLILSGTPLQNNTFDLFSQFQFLNPGLLGNKEFFRSEFANLIDKHNDVEKSGMLKKIVYPFLMRRTKEQVAKDLPTKTESIIYCEMGKKQRKVYDEYKAHYREMILQKIDDIGMSKSGMYVLEGLLRLRQICDSPALVKNEKVTTIESVKIDELLRELTENTGDNKVLIFSQFTEMLALIAEALEENKLPYFYLDGQVKASVRKNLVDDFQKNDTAKLFLISLKAGGVGLNLTTANYVYIIDPWWNPAVEQQAIDRTHRIGQTNKIFSYKMICKDTVEEKIIQLQQNKKQIANELITEDAGFFKKLKREDVAFLFE